jgi:uncharacterized membrane protein (UPF0127 family)
VPFRGAESGFRGKRSCGSGQVLRGFKAGVKQSAILEEPDGGKSFMNRPGLLETPVSEMKDEKRATRSQAKVERPKYCVYNHTRESFLSLEVTAADTTFSRLKGLIGRLKLRPNEGLWVVPSSGVHTIGVLFPLDLIYLDDQSRVIHTIEHLPAFRIAPLRTHAASVLELPTHTIYSSQTQVGDELVVCQPEDMEKHLRRPAQVRVASS